jgi:C_GCAxxG_C_C family probable redox protein
MIQCGFSRVEWLLFAGWLNSLLTFGRFWQTIYRMCHWVGACRATLVPCQTAVKSRSKTCECCKFNLEEIMSPEEMRQKAIELFNQRFHCSQAILAVGQQKLNCVNEHVIKALGAFGGGIASSGRVCGVLTGGVALISSLFSRGNLEGTEDPRMWKLSSKLNRKFEELSAPFGDVNCAAIAQMNWRDAAAVKDFYSNPDSRRQHCVKLVGDFAYAMGELLEAEKLG